MKILLIEDEVKLAEYLRKGLGEVGYVVDVAHNGVDGLHMALEGGHDLLVLDAMLPGIDGFSLLAAFRSGDTALPLATLAARTQLYKSTALRLLASLEQAARRRVGLGVRLRRSPRGEEEEPDEREARAEPRMRRAHVRTSSPIASSARKLAAGSRRLRSLSARKA